MNKNLRKIVAIIALVLMVGFIAFSMMYLINKNLLNGAVGPIALFCLGFTLALYFVIVFDNKFGEEAMKKRAEEALKQLEEEEKEAQAEEKSEETTSEDDAKELETEQAVEKAEEKAE